MIIGIFGAIHDGECGSSEQQYAGDKRHSQSRRQSEEFPEEQPEGRRVFREVPRQTRGRGFAHGGDHKHAGGHRVDQGSEVA